MISVGKMVSATVQFSDIRLWYDEQQWKKMKMREDIEQVLYKEDLLPRG